MKRNKYGAKKTIIDGIKFDSQAEGRRYLVLKAMEKAGKIQRLELQPKFILQEKFRDEVWGAIKAINYVADFCYIEGGKVIVEDTKGMKTEVYKLKKKMLLNKYQGAFNFIETK